MCKYIIMRVFENGFWTEDLWQIRVLEVPGTDLKLIITEKRQQVALKWTKTNVFLRANYYLTFSLECFKQHSLIKINQTPSLLKKILIFFSHHSSMPHFVISKKKCIQFFLMQKSFKRNFRKQVSNSPSQFSVLVGEVCLDKDQMHRRRLSNGSPKCSNKLFNSVHRLRANAIVYPFSQFVVFPLNRKICHSQFLLWVLPTKSKGKCSPDTC